LTTVLTNNHTTTRREEGEARVPRDIISILNYIFSSYGYIEHMGNNIPAHAGEWRPAVEGPRGRGALVMMDGQGTRSEGGAASLLQPSAIDREPATEGGERQGAAAL